MRFTILIPTTGIRELELRRLFASLLEQTCKDFNVVIVSQINHVIVNDILNGIKNIEIKHIKLEKAGLSYARNQGLKYCDGDWVILSDDDAWYPTDSIEKLSNFCNNKYGVVLSEIFDPIASQYYKNYPTKQYAIKSKLQLMSKSSIEVAFNREQIKLEFDEDFGIGAKYCCGEEIDFLLRSFQFCRICYFPLITVYHQKKDCPPNQNQQLAKGALYAKHYNRLIARLITIRDVIKRRNVDKKAFWYGFNNYCERKYESKHKKVK